MKIEKQRVSANDTDRPVKLPEPSQTAAAQRLGDLQQQPDRRVYYETPHRRMHPTGWRTRRHFKRKNLRRSNEHYATVDRIGTQFTMLPMVTGTLVVLVVLASVLVSLTAVVEATQERFQQEV